MEKGFSEEHLYESRNAYNALTIPRRVRAHLNHRPHIPLDAHRAMNQELAQPNLAVISDKLGRLVLNYAQEEPIYMPRERWRFIEREELFYRRLGAEFRLRPLGREAVYFADCLEMKLPYYRES